MTTQGAWEGLFQAKDVPESQETGAVQEPAGGWSPLKDGEELGQGRTRSHRQTSRLAVLWHARMES